MVVVDEASVVSTEDIVTSRPYTRWHAVCNEKI